MRLLIGLFVFMVVPAIAMAAADEGGVPAHMTWRIIDFVIFAGIIYYFLRKPVANFFKERKESILNAFREAEELKAEAEKLLKETEEKLAKLDAEIEKILTTFRSMAESEKEGILKELEEAVNRIKESIEDQKRSLVSAAKLKLLKIISSRAIGAVRERLSNLSDEEHTKINKKFIGSIMQ